MTTTWRLRARESGHGWQAQVGAGDQVRVCGLPTGVPVFLPKSPLDHDLGGLPPLLIQVGDHEVIRDDAIALAAKAKAKAAGVEVWPNMAHLWHNFSYLPDAQRSLERIGQRVEKHTSGAAHG